MVAKLGLWWDDLRSSLWFIPALITLGAVVLALVTGRVDEVLLAAGRADSAWIFGGGTEGARGVLSSIASGIITVTGVDFSVSIVALQLASSLFSPRVLRNFMGDPANQIVLGVFIGTFTYTLLVLRTVRSEGPQTTAFIPSLSVTLAIALVLVSIGFLIYFIDHTARSIQASVIIERAAATALHEVNHLFPQQIGRAAEGAGEFGVAPPSPPFTVASRRAGYLRQVDEKALFALVEKGRLIIRMEPRIGDFLLPGSPLASVWPAGAIDAEAERAVRRAFVLGEERSPAQDLELAITQLVDIAVKALSPGVNDPTTAKLCLDRLAQVIVVLGERAMPLPYRTDGEGRVLFAAHRTTFERTVDLAFAQIRHFGAGVPSIVVHILRTLEQVTYRLPPQRRAATVAQAEAVLTSAREKISLPDDLAKIERAGDWLQTYRGYGSADAGGRAA